MEYNEYIATVETKVRIKAQSRDHATLMAERFQPSVFISAPGLELTSEEGVKVKNIKLA